MGKKKWVDIRDLQDKDLQKYRITLTCPANELNEIVEYIQGYGEVVTTEIFVEEIRSA